MGLMAYAARPWHLFALRAIQGLVAGYGPLTISMAAMSAPVEHMAQAIGTVQTAQRIGPGDRAGVRRPAARGRWAAQMRFSSRRRSTPAHS